MDLRLREIRADVEKQLADRRQVLRTPHIRLWTRDVYGRLRVRDGTRKPCEAKQSIANTRDVRTSIVWVYTSNATLRIYANEIVLIDDKLYDIAQLILGNEI